MNLLPANEVFYNELSNWNNLDAESQRELRKKYIDYECHKNVFDIFLGAMGGLLLHESAKAGGMAPKMFSNYSRGASAVIGGLGLYYALPQVERLFVGYHFDQNYPPTMA